MDKARIRVYTDVDGWHWSDDGLDYLDSRGRAYPTAARAVEAAISAAAQTGHRAVVITGVDRCTVKAAARDAGKLTGVEVSHA